MDKVIQRSRAPGKVIQRFGNTQQIYSDLGTQEKVYSDLQTHGKTQQVIQLSLSPGKLCMATWKHTEVYIAISEPRKSYVSIRKNTTKTIQQSVNPRKIQSALGSRQRREILISKPNYYIYKYIYIEREREIHVKMHIIYYVT